MAKERRRALIDDPDFAELAGLALPLKRLRNDDLFARLTRYLDFENADKTSNHPERENRELRRRQVSLSVFPPPSLHDPSTASTSPTSTRRL